MGQKFFISFNAADKDKADWIAWTLTEAGHEVAVYDWECPAGDNVPLWMNARLAWADRLIAVVSPDYVAARYSLMEWVAQLWNDPDGTKGSVIPVIVRPTPKIPPLLNVLGRIDLTNCTETEAQRRLLKGVDRPVPPDRKPAFEKIAGEAPDSQHAGPLEKPIFVQVNVDEGVPRWLKVSAAIAAVPSSSVTARAKGCARPPLEEWWSAETTRISAFNSETEWFVMPWFPTASHCGSSKKLGKNLRANVPATSAPKPPKSLSPTLAPIN